MIRTSETIAKISQALLTFQGQVDGVGKTKKNPAFKSNYATFENVRDTAVPELQAVGVVFLQTAGGIMDGIMSMTTRFIHAESGEWIEGVMDIPLGKKDPQGMGSAQTYAQRYQLMAMLGLPAVDDDGEATKEPARQQEQRTTDQRAFPNKIHQEPPEKPAGAPKSEAKAMPVAKRKELWASLMNDLKVESAKGTDAITRYMNDPEVKAEINSMGEWAKNFREEASALYKMQKTVEDEFGSPGQITSYVAPSFDHLESLIGENNG